MSGDMPGMNRKGKKGSIQDHGSPVLVETPDVPNLPFRMDGNVKEFHLIAEPVKQEIVPGRIVDLWGYNGSAPGPTIQVTRGDRVASSWTTTFPKQPRCTGTASRFLSRWMAHRVQAKNRYHPAEDSSTSSRSTRKNLLLPLPHGDAGNDRDDRRVRHAPKGNLQTPRRQGFSSSSSRNTPSCRTSMSRTP